MSNTILVINAGSSSIKFSLFNMDDGQELAKGLAQKLGNPDAQLSISTLSSTSHHALVSSDYQSTLVYIIEQLKQANLLDNLPMAVGHRVVHGGESFSECVKISQHVLTEIKSCSSLAPLHNPANIAGIESIAELYPDLPQVAVFDTAFHQTMAPYAYLYAIPYELYEQHSVRRYGFHGTSHQFVAEQARQRLSLDNDYGLITVHLGNGCSACAVKNGLSVDTTMGMTPLEGLVMGTRSGDVDPGLHEFLAHAKGWSIEEITAMFNKDSGLQGLSGLSNDMRTLIEAAETGHQRARLAIDVFCFRLARQIGALAMSLNRLDGIIFTGGIGENSALIRSQVASHLGILGCKIDNALNESMADSMGRISDTNSAPMLVIRTQEEWMIAQQTFTLISDN
ncbi:acetate kinase [Reinekea marina]|uniref:Acetate kinase n=1 Tax=Reinekea marina TaxID=1310421 RepID=A0ABV7WVK3_9GAMM|nr:acetate kinase [Reinekea marina]MDN3648873.1 acetate kinase [Reinekea marina]